MREKKVLNGKLLLKVNTFHWFLQESEKVAFIIYIVIARLFYSNYSWKIFIHYAFFFRDRWLLHGK